MLVIEDVWQRGWMARGEAGWGRGEGWGEKEVEGGRQNLPHR